jgi:hypothetical protein
MGESGNKEVSLTAPLSLEEAGLKYINLIFWKQHNNERAGNNSRLNERVGDTSEEVRRLGCL